MTPQDFIDYGKTFIGLPYIWGADGPDAYDCSGLVQKLLAYVALDPPGDQTADGLYQYFKGDNRAVPVTQAEAQCGTLVFFGKPSRVGHVAICLDNTFMIEAGKGGPDTTTVAQARARHAEVMISAINRRTDIVAFLTPADLPRQAGIQAAAPLGPFHAELAATFLTAVTPVAALVPGAAAGAVLTPEQAALRGYRAFVLKQAAYFRLDPYVIAGIGSRESGWGTNPLMKPPGPTGTGDRAKRKAKPPLRGAGLPPDGLGFGRGLLQIDWDAHAFARTGPWQDPDENIAYGCRVLRDNRSYLTHQLPGWSTTDVLFAAVAAYNAGAKRVLDAVTAGGVQAADGVTAHGNYASDVMKRADDFRGTGVFL